MLEEGPCTATGQPLAPAQPLPPAVPLNAKAMSVAGVGNGGGGGGTLHRAQTAQKLYAKAVYDNLADSSDELAFKKGDTLTVIEQDTDGLDGWWLCTLRGRQGLCPGNRLRILNSYDSGCFSPSPVSSPSGSLAASTVTLNSSICSAEIYENSSIISGSGSGSGSSGGSSGCISASQTQLNQSQSQSQSQLQTPPSQNQHQHQRPGSVRSWHISPNKVITPRRHGDVYIYNSYPQQQQQAPYSYHHHHQQHHHQQQHHHPQQQHPNSACPSPSPSASGSQYHSPQQIYSNQSIYQNFAGVMSNGSNGSAGGSEFETYDIPKPATPVNYDCPKNICRTLTLAAMKGGSLGGGCATPIQEESYDVPRSAVQQCPPLHNAPNHPNTMTPSSSNSSLLTTDSMSLSFSSSNRSSLANMPDYDIPRRNPLPVRAVHGHAPPGIGAQHHHKQQLQQQQQNSSQLATYDFPQPHSSAQSTPVQEKPPALPLSPAVDALLAAAATKELPLELCSALETLAKLQTETTSAITRLLSFVAPNWRVRERLEPVVMEVKLAALRLRTALHDLTEFSEGALGNATRSEDRNLALKLRPLVRALRDADKLIHDSSEALDVQGGWSLEQLARGEEKSACKPPDSLDQLIACALTLTEDVRQTTSFVQGNASLLFKRSLPADNAEEVVGPAVAVAAPLSSAASVPATTTARDRNSDEWLEDYDYVSFESKDATARKNSALREAFPPSLKNKFDTVLRAAETTAVVGSNAVPGAAVAAAGNANATNAAAAIVTPAAVAAKRTSELTDKDKLLVRYYAVPIANHMGDLRQAIDSFLETVEKNQPPKFFIAYGKFVVVSAHNLVTVGDIVHRNVSKAELRDKIRRCTDALCDALKTCVTKSKKAATHFPSVTAVQEMVDSVVDISHLAYDLKTAMLQAVQLTI